MPELRYPILLMLLEPGDPGYDRGARYLIEMPDHGRIFFRTDQGAHEFMRLHALKAVTAEEMDALRRIHAD